MSHPPLVGAFAPILFKFKAGQGKKASLVKRRIRADLF